MRRLVAVDQQQPRRVWQRVIRKAGRRATTARAGLLSRPATALQARHAKPRARVCHPSRAVFDLGSRTSRTDHADDPTPLSLMDGTCDACVSSDECRIKNHLDLFWGRTSSRKDPLENTNMFRSEPAFNFENNLAEEFVRVKRHSGGMEKSTLQVQATCFCDGCLVQAAFFCDGSDVDAGAVANCPFCQSLSVH